MLRKELSTISPGRVTVRLRLEDAVALAFFLLMLGLRIFFRGLRQEMVSPADVLIIIPAVSLLLAKELVHYFVAGKEARVPGAREASPEDEPSSRDNSVCVSGAPPSVPPETRILQNLPVRATRPQDCESQARASNDDLHTFVRPYWGIIRDWFPFFAILMMYYSLWGDATHVMITHDRDAALILWDRRLFGFQASLALQPYIRGWLTAWMEFAYLFHLWNIPLVACFIYLRRPRERFREMMCGVLVVTFLGLLGYILVPAIGPMYTLRAQYTVPLHQPLAIFNREVEFMDFVRIQRDVFPSLHVGMSFVVWLYAYRNSRLLFWSLSPFILSLWASTVYLRYHYLVDCLAGFALAPLSFVLANWLFQHFGEIPVSVPLGWTGRLGRLPLWVRRTSKDSGRQEQGLR